MGRVLSIFSGLKTTAPSVYAVKHKDSTLFPVVLQDSELVPRPKTRGECHNIQRPCPYATCQFNMLTEIGPKGQLEQRYPDVESMPANASCVLDVADQYGSLDVKEVAAIMLEQPKSIINLEESAIRRLRGFRVSPHLYKMRKLFDK